MKYGNALFIGIFQGIAILPGISRSGSTIGSSLIAGFSKEFAVKFSFILGIPAILGGCLLEIKDAVDMGASFDMLPVIVGFIVSAVAGFLSIKAVTWLVKTDKYKVFAIYTLIVGLASIGIGVMERL
jgi:undecaprenyl-diphosphatase